MSNIHNQTLPEGTQLGVYEIKAVSKVDRFEITYRAWNHHLKEWVEIHEYFPHDFAIRTKDGLGVESRSASDKEKFDYGLQAFLSEYEKLAQIEHANIVKAENSLQFNGTAYLITDYPEGAPLYKLISSQTTFDDTELKFILVSVLNALQKVHEDNIVHGGIQPETIILSNNGEPQLTGFAIARLTLAENAAKLENELATGYAPPELYKSAGNPGPGTDFYALGATMYYCITHNQPTAAQSRLLALSKGELDPIASLSASSGTAYSAELLQAIDWMLRPEYSNRPKSAAEILALLQSEPVGDQKGTMSGGQEAENLGNTNRIARNPLWIGVMAGIAGLLVVGLWLLGKKPSEISSDKVNAVTVQPLDQSNPGTSKPKEDQPVALPTTPSAQESEPGKQAAPIEKEINEPEKQPIQDNDAMQLSSAADESQAKNNRIEQTASFTESNSVPNTQPNDKVTTGQEPGESQQIAVIEKSQEQPKKQGLPKKPGSQDSVKGYLAAAKNAMKAVRLTTPAEDNAYKYYQMVLAIEPDNAEARAGLQKIVDRYIWFVQKSKAEGKLSTAMRALQKAESVLPDDPRLQRIRAELAAAKK